MKPFAKKYHYLALVSQNTRFFWVCPCRSYRKCFLSAKHHIFAKYITIPCQKKKFGRKILIFHDENPFSKFEIEKKIDKILKIFRIFFVISKFSFFKLIFRRHFFGKFLVSKKKIGNFFFRKKNLRKINLKNENFEISENFQNFVKFFSISNFENRFSS